MGNYMNLMADWAFKRVFGSEDNKECLITFLNGLFEGEFRIKDVKFQNTEQIRHSKDGRGVIFDVKCITDDNRHIIVEMQKKQQEFFVDRALYYSAKAITAQEKTGDWDFQLEPVYTVCFMDFKVQNGIPQKFRTDIGLGLLEDVISKSANKRSGKRANKSFKLSGQKYGFEKIRIVYLQLPFFEKKEKAECMSIFDCWIYVIKNMEQLKDMPFVKKYPVFRMLAEIGDLRKLSPEDREKYDEDIKVMRDLYATRKFEEKQRMEAERQHKKDLKKCKAESRTSRSIEIAKNMLALGIAEELVMESTGLSADELAKLKS